MSNIDFKKMVSLFGVWEYLADGVKVKFKTNDGDDSSHGLVLLSSSMDDGVLECDIQLPEADSHSGAFVVFRANGQSSYFAAGLGGWDGAYTICQGAHLTLTRLASAGSISNLISGRTYKVRIAIEGQKLTLAVDEVTVLSYDRLPTASGTGLGLFSFRGNREALFGPMTIDDRRPNAFIAMQFSEPYNEVYRDAIRPLIEQIGYEPLRVDEISGPGIILNDIWNHIAEASVVIAEISEPNPNVYYEIGVAHALQKPTVLLANKGTKLPFDLGPHRCIFYENSIPGRQRLLDALRSSLSSLLGLPLKP